MEFRTSRTTKVERDRLLDASGLPGVALDRLATALSVVTPSAAGEDPGVVWPSQEARDGTVHDTEEIDNFEGQQVLRSIFSAMDGRMLDDRETAERMRFHLNRGYDLLYQAFESAGSDWEKTMVAVAPTPTAPATPATRSEAAELIEVRVGQIPGGQEPILWRFNQEAGSQTNSNVRLAGMPGVGKSQVLLHLLASIAEQAPGTGFVLFDYKGDLWTNQDFLTATGARVLHPGEEPIPINPFQLPPGVNRTLAPRAFAELFEALEPRIGMVQKRLVARAMEWAYAGSAEGRGYPTLAEVVEAIEMAYQEADRPEDTVLAALHDLCHYNLFAEVSEHSLEDVLSCRWVVNLSTLRGLREFVAFVLLEFLHQTVRQLGDAPFDVTSQVRGVRGVVALDEAHYYLKQRRCQPLLDLVRIGRSKGVPVFLSSQSLEDFKTRTELNEFLPNTFLFKHGVAPDRKTLAGALGLGMSEAEEVSSRIPGLEKFTGFATVAREASSGGLAPVRLTGLWERVKAH